MAMRAPEASERSWWATAASSEAPARLAGSAGRRAAVPAACARKEKTQTTAAPSSLVLAQGPPSHWSPSAPPPRQGKQSQGRLFPRGHLPLLLRPFLEGSFPLPPEDGGLEAEAMAMLICPSWISCRVSAGRWLIFCCASR